MGFFSNLFSKQPCELCGKEAGALGRFKLADGLYVCNDCRKNTSAFANVQKYNIEQLKKHIEYMKLQNEFYEKAFETLPDNKKERIVRQGYYGIVFADELGMFEIIHPEAKKRNYKELFRYDQIKDFMPYAEENHGTGEGQKRYSETGLRIIMNCAQDIDSVSASAEQRKLMHPYAMEFKLPVDRNTDTVDAGLAKHHLNKIFGRPDETLFGSIKESFTGTGRVQTGYKAANQAAGALGSFIKGAVTGNSEDIDAAKDKLKAAAETGMAFASENKTMYQKIADEAEIKVMGKTFRDFLYSENEE